MKISQGAHYVIRCTLTDFLRTRAIALSLQDVPGPAARLKETEVIEISDDEDEDPNRPGREETRFQEELQRAIEASEKEERRREASQPAVQATPTSSSGGPSPATSFLSERAIMEQERLARQKRLRPDLDVDGSPSMDDGAHKSKRQHLSPSAAETRRADVRAYSSATSSRAVSSTSAAASMAPRTISSRSPEQWFWNGEMRQIANAHVDRAKDTKPTFRLSDILAPVSCMPTQRSSARSCRAISRRTEWSLPSSQHTCTTFHGCTR